MLFIGMHWLKYINNKAKASKLCTTSIKDSMREIVFVDKGKYINDEIARQGLVQYNIVLENALVYM